MDNEDIIIIVNEIFTSSSSSESSEKFDDIFNENCRCRRRIPRLQNYVENVVARYNDVEFKENFRLVALINFYMLKMII